MENENKRCTMALSRYGKCSLSSQEPEKMKTPEWTIADIPPETGKIAVVTGRTAGLAGIRLWSWRGRAVK
jgi:hypothetical protein